MSNLTQNLQPAALNVPQIAASAEDKAYAAGWFDARGYFRMSVSEGRTPRMTIHIQAGRANPAFFFDRWGGKLGVNQGTLFVVPGKSSRSSNGVKSWQIARLPAKNFLLDIAPYCLNRGHQIHLALEFIKYSVECDPKPNRQYLTELAKRIRVENVSAMAWTD